MAMSIRGLPDDVKESLKLQAQRRGMSLNSLIVEILCDHVKEYRHSQNVVDRYAGTSTWEDVLESRKIEQEDALDWSMSYDASSGR